MTNTFINTGPQNSGHVTAESKENIKKHIISKLLNTIAPQRYSLLDALSRSFLSSFFISLSLSLASHPSLCLSLYTLLAFNFSGVTYNIYTYIHTYIYIYILIRILYIYIYIYICIYIYINSYYIYIYNNNYV